MSLHPLLKQPVRRLPRGRRPLDLRKLLHAISDAYAEWDEESNGVVRSMRLLADETSAFTREVRESAAAQLQSFSDHVEDAIIHRRRDGPPFPRASRDGWRARQRRNQVMEFHCTRSVA